jgi:hypothetical protein
MPAGCRHDQCTCPVPDAAARPDARLPDRPELRRIEREGVRSSIDHRIRQHRTVNQELAVAVAQSTHLDFPSNGLASRSEKNDSAENRDSWSSRFKSLHISRPAMVPTFVCPRAAAVRIGSRRPSPSSISSRHRP